MVPAFIPTEKVIPIKFLITLFDQPPLDHEEQVTMNKNRSL